MAVTPVVDEGLGNSAYVVDLGDGGGLVIDPERDPRPYATTLAAAGLRPRFVVETHLHADFVSGGPELVARGAELLAPAGSELATTHRPLADGDEVELGGLTLQVIATPGHTPEHLAYLLKDGARPVGLFCGGTLMAGGIARTDLLSPELTEPLARQAYRSIHDRLFTLPDDLPVFPTHGAGSFCSAAPGGERTTTIGREKATNPLLADDPDEDTFVAQLLSGYGTYPPYFLELREVNRAGPAVLGTGGPTLPALTPGAFQAAIETGAEVVDARSSAAFAAGHLAWAAATVGYDRLVGVLAGGMDGWRAEGRPIATIPLLTAHQTTGRRIVDVRQRNEHLAGHVAGSLNAELGSLVTAPEQVELAPTLVHCGHNERAMSAASLLARAGHPEVAALDGGPQDLAQAGAPLEVGA